MATLGDLPIELLDYLMSALPLQELFAARLSNHLLRARVQRRFLPVIMPPALADVGELSEEAHGTLLIRHFAEYQAWLRRWWHLEVDRRLSESKVRTTAFELELRAQQSVADGFFSLAPWWRAFGEVVPTPWQPEMWLQDAVYAAADVPNKSAFYQRRNRLEDDDELFRRFYSTPAEVRRRQPATTHIVIAPLNVRMSLEPVHTRLASLPTLSSAMLASIAVAAELLEAYLPMLEVRIEPTRDIAIERSMTRGDRQDARTHDGKRVRQLSSRGLHGARHEIDVAAQQAGEPPPFITYVVAPHLYPGELGERYAWVYSTRLSELDDEARAYDDERVDAWAVSTHQIEAYVDSGAGQTRSLCNMVLYCVLMEAMDLEVCESAACLLNNCDSVEESEQVPSMLCPTCFRKLHLMGAVYNVPECHARVQEVLKRHFG